MNTLPLAFISKAFLNEFFKSVNNPNYTYAQAKNIEYVEKILKYKCIICIDIPQTKVNEYANPMYCPLDRDDEFFWKNISVFIMQNKIRGSETLLEFLSSYSLFRDLKQKPNLIFISDDQSKNNINEALGILAFTNKLEDVRHHFSNEESQKRIERGGTFEKDIFFNNLPAVHTLIIRDPYIQKQDVGFIIKLISCFKLAKETPVTLKICYENNDTIEKDNQFKEKVRNGIADSFPDITFDKISLDWEIRHNRHIYTNSFWIKSDYGFMSHYTKDSTTFDLYTIMQNYPIFYSEANKYF